MKTVKLKKGKLIVDFPYNPRLVSIMHRLHGKYREKKWVVPSSGYALETLEALGFQLSPKASSLRKTAPTTTPVGGTGRKPHLDLVPAVLGWQKQPFPFQLQGISFLEDLKGKALLADEMGLGKTVQSIGYIWNHRDEGPVVVVCPASIKIKWKREIIRWTGCKKKLVRVASGRRAKPWKRMPWVIIINYDVLTKWTRLFKEMKPQLVLDEIHLIKNNSAKRTKAVKRLAKHSRGVIGLSGTPILNRPVELFNTVQLIRPKLFSSFWEFGKRYCGAWHDGYKWQFSKATNVEELRQILTGSIMLRRTKKEVLKELPDKIKSIVPIEINNREEYKLAEDDFATWLEASGRTGIDCVLAKIEVLKQLCIQGKLAMAVEWIRDFLDSGEKLVLFAHHKTTIDTLEALFYDKCVVLDGRTIPAERQEMVDLFQTHDKFRLFIGNLKAAGVGIDLTAASNVAILELPWTPADLDQAEDRCHRIGQKASMTCWYLLAEDTIEEQIMKMLDKKRKVVDALIDGKKTGKDHLLLEMLKSWKEGRHEESDS